MSVSVLVAAAFAAGCAAVGIVWALVTTMRAKKTAAESASRNEVARAIGALCAEVENALASQKTGAREGASLKATISGKLEAIQRMLRENMHQLDQFHSRYLEYYVADRWRELAAVAPPAPSVHAGGEALAAHETAQIPTVRDDIRQAIAADDAGQATMPSQPVVAPVPETPHEEYAELEGDATEAPDMIYRELSRDGEDDGEIGGWTQAASAEPETDAAEEVDEEPFELEPAAPDESAPSANESKDPVAGEGGQPEPAEEGSAYAEPVESGGREAAQGYEWDDEAVSPESMVEPDSAELFERSAGLGGETTFEPTAPAPATSESTEYADRESVEPEPIVDDAREPQGDGQGTETADIGEDAFAPPEPTGDTGDSDDIVFDFSEALPSPEERDDDGEHDAFTFEPPTPEMDGPQVRPTPQVGAEPTLEQEDSLVGTGEEQDGELLFDLPSEDAEFPMEEETMVMDMSEAMGGDADNEEAPRERNVHITPTDSEFVSSETQIFDHRLISPPDGEDADEPDVFEPFPADAAPEPAGTQPEIEPEDEAGFDVALPPEPSGQSQEASGIDDSGGREPDDRARGTMDKKQERDDSLITGEDIVDQMDSFFGI